MTPKQIAVNLFWVGIYFTVFFLLEMVWYWALLSAIVLRVVWLLIRWAWKHLDAPYDGDSSNYSNGDSGASVFGLFDSDNTFFGGGNFGGGGGGSDWGDSSDSGDSGGDSGCGGCGGD